MSCTGNYSFCFKKGFSLELTWTDSADVPIVLTGYTAKMTLRNRKTSQTRFFVDLTTANGKIVLGGSPYNIIVKASPQDTALAPSEAYDYDLELAPGTGEITTLLFGVATKESSAVSP